MTTNGSAIIVNMIKKMYRTPKNRIAESCKVLRYFIVEICLHIARVLTIIKSGSDRKEGE
jgi:hypothetical protein